MKTVKAIAKMVSDEPLSNKILNPIKNPQEFLAQARTLKEDNYTVKEKAGNAKVYLQVMSDFTVLTFDFI